MFSRLRRKRVAVSLGVVAALAVAAVAIAYFTSTGVLRSDGEGQPVGSSVSAA
jgi:hypothetical protein